MCWVAQGLARMACTGARPHGLHGGSPAWSARGLARMACSVEPKDYTLSIPIIKPLLCPRDVLGGAGARPHGLH
eukprot:4893932-Pyramimonas_sp.AAC.1